jgi:hypothetical protein
VNSKKCVLNCLNNLKILKILAPITYEDLKILKLKKMCLLKKLSL